MKMRACNFSHLIFDIDVKNIHWRKKYLNQMVWGQVDVDMEKNETEPYQSAGAFTNDHIICMCLDRLSALCQ